MLGEYIFFDWGYKNNSIQFGLSPGVNYTFLTLAAEYLASLTETSGVVYQQKKASGLGFQCSLIFRLFHLKHFFYEGAVGYRMENPTFSDAPEVFDAHMFSLESGFGFQF